MGVRGRELGGWEAGIGIMKYSKGFLFPTLFSLLTGCTDPGPGNEERLSFHVITNSTTK